MAFRRVFPLRNLLVLDIYIRVVADEIASSVSEVSADGTVASTTESSSTPAETEDSTENEDFTLLMSTGTSTETSTTSPDPLAGHPNLEEFLSQETAMFIENGCWNGGATFEICCVQGRKWCWNAEYSYKSCCEEEIAEKKKRVNLQKLYDYAVKYNRNGAFVKSHRVRRKQALAKAQAAVDTGDPNAIAAATKGIPPYTMFLKVGEEGEGGVDGTVPYAPPAQKSVYSSGADTSEPTPEVEGLDIAQYGFVCQESGDIFTIPLSSVGHVIENLIPKVDSLDAYQGEGLPHEGNYKERLVDIPFLDNEKVLRDGILRATFNQENAYAVFNYTSHFIENRILPKILPEGFKESFLEAPAWKKLKRIGGLIWRKFKNSVISEKWSLLMTSLGVTYDETSASVRVMWKKGCEFWLQHVVGNWKTMQKRGEEVSANAKKILSDYMTILDRIRLEWSKKGWTKFLALFSPSMQRKIRVLAENVSSYVGTKWEIISTRTSVYMTRFYQENLQHLFVEVNADNSGLKAILKSIQNTYNGAYSQLNQTFHDNIYSTYAAYSEWLFGHPEHNDPLALRQRYIFSPDYSHKRIHFYITNSGFIVVMLMGQFMQLRRDKRQSKCFEKIEQDFLWHFERSGIMANPQGNPKECLAHGTSQFHWLVLSGTLSALCVPNDCAMSDQETFVPILSAFLARMAKWHFGCLSIDEKMGTGNQWPQYSMTEMTPELLKEFRETCPPWERYFPSFDRIRMRQLYAERKYEMVLRISNLEFARREHNETWRTPNRNWLDRLWRWVVFIVGVASVVMGLKQLIVMMMQFVKEVYETMCKEVFGSSSLYTKIYKKYFKKWVDRVYGASPASSSPTSASPLEEKLKLLSLSSSFWNSSFMLKACVYPLRIIAGPIKIVRTVLLVVMWPVRKLLSITLYPIFGLLVFPIVKMAFRIAKISIGCLLRCLTCVFKTGTVRRAVLFGYRSVETFASYFFNEFLLKYIVTYIVEPLCLQESLKELLQFDQSGKSEMGICVIRVSLCLSVIYVHTCESYEWERKNQERNFVDRAYWIWHAICFCLHRVNTLFVCLSTHLILRSIKKRYTVGEDLVMDPNSSSTERMEEIPTVHSQSGNIECGHRVVKDTHTKRPDYTQFVANGGSGISYQDIWAASKSKVGLANQSTNGPSVNEMEMKGFTLPQRQHAEFHCPATNGTSSKSSTTIHTDPCAVYGISSVNGNSIYATSHTTVNAANALCSSIPSDFYSSSSAGTSTVYPMKPTDVYGEAGGSNLATNGTPNSVYATTGGSDSISATKDETAHIAPPYEIKQGSPESVSAPSSQDPNSRTSVESCFNQRVYLSRQNLIRHSFSNPEEITLQDVRRRSQEEIYTIDQLTKDGALDPISVSTESIVENAKTDSETNKSDTKLGNTRRRTISKPKDIENARTWMTFGRYQGGSDQNTASYTTGTAIATSSRESITQKSRKGPEQMSLILLLRILIKQITQRLARQSPIMLFWCYYVIVLAKNITFRPMETAMVWYNYRPAICRIWPRWFVSSFYIHSLYYNDFHRESLCHNTAIFESEFQIVLVFMLFALFSVWIRGKVIRYFTIPDSTSPGSKEAEAITNDENDENHKTVENEMHRYERGPSSGKSTQDSRYQGHDSRYQGHDTSSSRRWGERDIRWGKRVSNDDDSPDNRNLAIRLINCFWNRNRYAEDFQEKNRSLAGKIHLGFRLTVETGVLLYVQYRIVAGIFGFVLARNQMIDVWTDNPLLERSPRTVFYLLSIAILIYLFEEILPLIRIPFFTVLKLPFMPMLWILYCCFGVELPDSIQIAISEMLTLNMEKLFRKYFHRYWIFSLGPLIIVLIIDISVCIHGRMVVMHDRLDVMEEELPIMWKFYTLVPYILDFQKFYLGNEPQILDYFLDLPTTFGFYNLLKKLESETTIRRQRSKESAASSGIGGCGRDGTTSTAPTTAPPTAVELMLPGWHYLFQVMSRLSFGMNLANIFVLHYIVCYVIAEELAMSTPGFVGTYLFVVIASILVSAVTFCFVERPCSALWARWVGDRL